MKLNEVLQTYKRSDLNRLARNRINNYMALPKEALLEDLLKLLSTYEAIKNNVNFRMPPADSILDVLIESENHRTPIKTLKNKVREQVKQMISEASQKNWTANEKQYDLYSAMLKSAWNFHDDLDASECNLLSTLREYLGISYKEHRLIQASPKIGYFKFSEESYNRELGHLLNNGVILLINGDYIIPEEVIDDIYTARGIELRETDYQRMLKYFSNSQLEEMLAALGVPVSGSKEEKIARIIQKEIRPSYLLSKSTVNNLRDGARKAGLTSYEPKEILIARLTEHIRTKADIIKDEIIEEDPQDLPLEARKLTDESFKELLSLLTVTELSQIISKLEDVRKSGVKNEKIENLVLCRHSEEHILNHLNKTALQRICKQKNIDPYRKKENLLNDIICFHANEKEKPSGVNPELLFDIYNEISLLQKHAYSGFEGILHLPSFMSINVDFELVTRWIIENIFKISVVKQSFKGAKYDGLIKGDNIIMYDCKAAFDFPYNLPDRHVAQLLRDLNNVTARLDVNEKPAFKMLLIISPRFSDGFAERLKLLQTDFDIAAGGICSNDFRVLALDWKLNHPNEVFPSSKLIFNGVFSQTDDYAGLPEIAEKAEKQKRISEITKNAFESISDQSLRDIFSSLTNDEKLIFHFLMQHERASENEIERFLDNEGYSITLIKAKMNRLIRKLNQNDDDIIEIISSDDNDFYSLSLKEELSE